MDDVAPSKEIHEAAPFELPRRQSTIKDEKPELDRTPLEGEQLEKLYELIKLAEGTAEWMEETAATSKRCS